MRRRAEKRKVLSYSGMGRLLFFHVNMILLRRTEEKDGSADRGPVKSGNFSRNGIFWKKRLEIYNNTSIKYH